MGGGSEVEAERGVEEKKYIHPRNLAWNNKMKVWKMFFLCKWMIFGFHVSFAGCTPPRVPPFTGRSEKIIDSKWTFFSANM